MISNNTLAFMALCNEYCAAVQSTAETEPTDFVSAMVRLLPRIYITASDLDAADADAEGYIDSALDEDSYDSVRRNIEMLLGEHDTYLEVFEDDMKYSDTPIGASVAEQLADLFQVFYNFLEAVRDAPDDLVASAVAAVSEDFREYWSQIVCNVMRPLNKIMFSI